MLLINLLGSVPLCIVLLQLVQVPFDFVFFPMCGGEGGGRFLYHNKMRSSEEDMLCKSLSVFYR
jgi:hypothetical protein